MTGKTNRKAAEDFIIEWIGKILPEENNKVTENQQTYINLFASMDDTQFHDFMTKLDEGAIKLAIISPNFGSSRLTVNNNLDLAEELGHNFFERIWMSGDTDIPRYLSPVKYLIVDLPLKRQAQLLVKKISIPEDNKSIDDFTGQPTGKSKGSKISYPETQIMAAMNLDNNLVEMLKYRGGDIKGFDLMNASISKTGGVSLANMSHAYSKVRSTETLKTLLTSMHLSTTI
jgi:hypothetical protein